MPAGFWMLAAVIVIFTLAAGCGGGEDDTAEETAPVAEGTVAQGGGDDEDDAGDGEGTVVVPQDEENIPFTLNTDQPVPPGFQRAYERGDLITVLFYKEGQDPFYPQGLSVDGFVTDLFTELGSEYPEVEFFAYELNAPGPSETETPGTTNGGEEGLEPGEYGTLPAQLDVGYTPYVAMFAPSGDEYIITDVFRGYITREVLNQALFNLTATELEDGGGGDPESTAGDVGLR